MTGRNASGTGRSAHIATGGTPAPARTPRPTAVTSTGMTGTTWSTGSPVRSSPNGTGAMRTRPGTMTTWMSGATMSGSGMIATTSTGGTPASGSTTPGDTTTAGSTGTTGTTWSTGSPPMTITTGAVTTTTTTEHQQSLGSLPIGKGASSLTPVSVADLCVERAYLPASKPALHSDGTGKLYSNFLT